MAETSTNKHDKQSKAKLKARKVARDKSLAILEDRAIAKAYEL